MVRVQPNALVRAIRTRLGLTQRDLAQRSGVAQPSICAFETSRRDVTAASLSRIAGGLGYQLALLPAGYLTAVEAAVRIRETVASEGPARAEIHLLQFADDLAAAEPVLRCALVATPAPLTGDRHLDAWLAGIVEHRLAEVGVAAPPWVNEPERTSPDEWVAGGVASLADVVRDRTPEPLRRRGVLLSGDDLVGA